MATDAKDRQATARCTQMRSALLLSLLLASASSLIVEPEAAATNTLQPTAAETASQQPAKPAARRRNQAEEPAIDRYSHFKVRPKLAYATSALLVGAATGMQVITPDWLQRTLPEWCASAAGATALRCVEYLQNLKTSSPLGFTMSHGILAKAVAEVFAQVIPQAHLSRAWLDPLRIVRSTLASLLSSSLTFFYWTRWSVLRGLRAPGWLSSVLGKAFGTSVTKTAFTQAIYRPINIFLFLAMQARLRARFT